MRYTFSLFILALLTFSISAQAQTRQIKTIAGNGTQGFFGDGGAAPGAELNVPLGVAIDNMGNVYIDDYGNKRIRKVSINGVITTVAGTGVAGNTGNGSVGTSAKVSPHSVAVDKHGNIYMSDASYSVVRKVDAVSNIITTIAGNGIWGYTGNGSPAIYAQLHTPLGLAFDNMGNLYIADAGNHAIRMVDTAGIISTVAGMDSAGYSGDGGLADTARLDSPVAVAVDPMGNIYISDYGNNVIRKVSDGIITTFAGTQGVYGFLGDGGLAALAQLFYPEGLAVDTFGNLFIADANNNVIREVDTFGIIHTVAGNNSPGFGGDLGDALGANLHNPYAIAVDAYGGLYIADANNERIRKTYSLTGVIGMTGSTPHIVVSPNPFINQVTVSGLDQTDKIRVYDIIGRPLSELMNVTANGSQTLTINGLSPGIYLLQAYDQAGNKKATVQLAKE
jgi:sugar lactone lactonase YvrE